MYSFAWKGQDDIVRQEIINLYNIHLTDEEKIAIKYVEGEKEDYSPTLRVMNELGAFCHCCDVLSSRLWHNYPNDSDNWSKKKINP